MITYRAIDLSFLLLLFADIYYFVKSNSRKILGLNILILVPPFNYMFDRRKFVSFSFFYLLYKNFKLHINPLIYQIS